MGRIVGVVFLAGLGFLVGVLVSAQGGGSYTATTVFSVPGDSHAAMQLAAVARSQHIRGVRVRVDGAYTFEVTGHGSSGSAVHALSTVNRQIRKAVRRLRLAHVNAIFGGLHELVRPSQDIAIRHGVIGLLAGLGIGLGIVVPFRRRAAAAHVS